MFLVHGFLDDKKVLNAHMEHLPRTGETIRFFGEKYGQVTEVIWCLDERDIDGYQRINLRISILEGE